MTRSMTFSVCGTISTPRFSLQSGHFRVTYFAICFSQSIGSRSVSLTLLRGFGLFGKDLFRQTRARHSRFESSYFGHAVGLLFKPTLGHVNKAQRLAVMSEDVMSTRDRDIDVSARLQSA